MAHYPKIHQNTVCQVHHDIRAFACHEFDRIPWHLWQSKLGKIGKNGEKWGKIAVLKCSEVAPVPGPSPLLAGDFATLQRLLSDSVGSDARGPPALCLQDLRVEVRPWTAYRCSGQYIENTQRNTSRKTPQIPSLQRGQPRLHGIGPARSKNRMVSPQISTDLHIPILSMAHGPWPINRTVTNEKMHP